MDDFEFGVHMALNLNKSGSIIEISTAPPIKDEKENQEHRTIINDLFNKLPPLAKEMVKLALECPTEIASAYEGKISINSMYKSLNKRGHKWKEILSAREKVNEFVRSF